MIEELEHQIDGLIVLEPRDMYDPCIIGVVTVTGGDRKVLYSLNKIITAIAAEVEDEEEQSLAVALEHWSFNMTTGEVVYLEDLE